MREQEREALIDLWQEAWQAARPEIDFGARRLWFTGYLADLQRDGAVVIVAEMARETAGFATIHPQTGYLDTLAVALLFQRKGVARALLAEAARIAPQGVTLKVNTLNLAAQALYAREGFIRTGEEVKPESGETVLILFRSGSEAARWEEQAG